MNNVYILLAFVVFAAGPPVAFYLMNRRSVRRADDTVRPGLEAYRTRKAERVAARQAELDADPRTRGLVASEVVACSLDGTITHGIEVARDDRPLADLVDHHTRSK
jgi:hypothetical protein